MFALILLGLALGASMALGQASLNASPGSSAKTPAPAAGANAWMAIPTAFSDRNRDGPPESPRPGRDQFWDNAIGARVPLTPHPAFGSATSEGAWTDKEPEIPKVPNRVVLTATFVRHRSILSESARSIYTEVAFLVDDVFEDQSGHTAAHGQYITVGLPGGSVLDGSGQKISYLIQPRKLFLQPEKKYLLVLSYKPEVDFYTVGDSWDISDGTVRLNSVRNTLLQREGRSSLVGLRVDQLPQALSELLAQTE
jgi:hypothetical protein